VTNITPFLSNTNKLTIAHCFTQSESSSWLFSKWPETLMAQHNELDFEIGSVHSLLNTNNCNLIQLDVRLKKLTKAVLTHLELEDQFLIPILTATKVLSQQKNYLNEGFDALFEICRATTAYVHSLKLAFGNCLVTDKQIKRITSFLDEIKNRLNDEDFIYSKMTDKGINHEV